MRVCPKCERNVFENETACSHCGGTVEEAVRPFQSSETKVAERQDGSFNPRTDVSADAIYIASRIVKHLWIIFVLLPFILGVLWTILTILDNSHVLVFRS